ncbi:Putative ribonuclease H protein At1g65750 [Linum perenne]
MDLVDGADISQRLDECVADYASPDGEWDYDKLALLLPDDAIKLVIGISPPNADRGDDQWTWGEERNGLFSIKSAYRIICKLENSKLEDPWLSVWKWGGRETEISWDPGPPGWVTLNTDGSVIPSRAAATAGGLLRDEMGRCLLAYTVNLGNCSITRAELRGAIEGLKRTWDAGFRRVVLLLDSKAAISLLNGSQGTAHQHGMEVLQFRELLDRDWTIQIKHTYREGNHAADFLASIGYDYPFGSHTISISDCNLGYFIRYDCMGISETRSVLIND